MATRNQSCPADMAREDHCQEDSPLCINLKMKQRDMQNGNRQEKYNDRATAPVKQKV